MFYFCCSQMMKATQRVVQLRHQTMMSSPAMLMVFEETSPRGFGLLIEKSFLPYQAPPLLQIVDGVVRSVQDR